MLKGEGVSGPYLDILTHNMVKRVEIKRVTRGIYTFNDESAVVGFAFQPFYYSMENALSLRGMSEQATNFVVMTTRNARTGVRLFEDRNYRVQHINKRHFFGYGLMRYGEYWLPVSDIEKTIIDLVYLGDHVSNEAIKRSGHSIGRWKKAFRISQGIRSKNKEKGGSAA